MGRGIGRMLPGQSFVDATVALSERAALAGHVLPPERHAELTLVLAWGRVDVEPFIPLEVADDSIPVRCEQGRWLVDCPFCGNSQFASKTDPRFFCVSCLCEQAGARWLRVEWPRDVEAIEAALRPRLTENANYLPGQTVKELLAENAENGVGD